jgi:hypothetical protein
VASAPCRYSRRGLALVVIALVTCTRTGGPEPIVFDRESCAHCRMLISDPAFAAQLQTEDGETFNFDDPGCLLRWRAEHAPHVRAVWFHHLHEERWLPEAEVAFVPVARTPMGYGLGAVDAGTPNAISRAQAEERVAAHGDEAR